jgi:SAM-dependent methyltransferase
LARYLVKEPLGSYTGFDRHRGMIDWCKSEIEPRAPHFTFHYFDLKSCYQSVDNQSGDIPVESFQFPFENNCFDIAVLMSVFTHMPLDEIRHYLRELYRVLAQGGTVVLTVFLTKKLPYVDTINYYYNPEEFREAVVSSGLQFSPQDSTRLLTGANLNFDQFQHNGFLLRKN